MTPDQAEKKYAVDGINKVMKRFMQSSYVEPPDQVIRSDGYKKLNRHQLDQGVVALVLAANLSGGSIGGDVDLYKLVRTYLWGEEARNEINAVVGRYGL